jgi:hypothetical protein
LVTSQLSVLIAKANVAALVGAIKTIVRVL